MEDDDALGLCVFGYAPRGTMSLEEIVQCVNGVTGWNASLFELMKAAERSTIIARAFNSREGFTIKDDKLPGRLFDPKPDGPEAGKRVFSQTDFHKAVELLYDLIGCDSETGRPQRGKLIELGLEWVDKLLTRSQK